MVWGLLCNHEFEKLAEADWEQFACPHMFSIFKARHIKRRVIQEVLTGKVRLVMPSNERGWARPAVGYTRSALLSNSTCQRSCFKIINIDT